MGMMFGYVNYDHPLAPPEQVAEYERIKKEVEDEIRPLARQIAQIETPYRKAAYEQKLAKFPEEIQIAVRTPDEQRTPGQKLLAAQIVSLDVDADAAANVSVTASYRQMMKVSEADDAVRQELVKQIQEIQKRMPPPLPIAEGIRDGDYRLTPDGPGDEPLPGKGTRFEYGIDCCFVPDKTRGYEPPPVYFGANGMDVAEDQRSPVVEPGFPTVLTNGTGPRLTHPPSDGRVSADAAGRWPNGLLRLRTRSQRV